MRVDKYTSIQSLNNKELIDLVTDIYINYKLQCDNSMVYDIMTKYIVEIQSTQTKYNKEDLELIIKLSK